MIKDWWAGLAEREQRMLFWGGVAAIILLTYALIWTPLTSAVSERRESIQNQQSLLSYLHRASAAISQLRASGVEITQPDEDDLTTHVESVFSAQGISAFIKQVQQPATREVSMHLEAVPFDKLMQALHALAHSDVSVVQFNASRQKETGLADVRVTLMR